MPQSTLFRFIGGSWHSTAARQLFGPGDAAHICEVSCNVTFLWTVPCVTMLFKRPSRAESQMVRSRMKILRAPEAALTIALLSACGGGGGTAPPSTTTLANQTSGLSPYPISNNRVVLSPTGGYTGAVTLPSVSSGAGAMVRIGTQTMPPTGVAILSLSARPPAGAPN